jgi:predicted MarR family transcription regulator
VSGLLGGGSTYTAAQMTYDLRRLRLKGLIRRIERTNRYVLTPEGIRVAVFYTKLHNRLLGPLLAADRPPASLELRNALRVIDRQVNDYVQHTRMGVAA